jgi:hypothetical protein
VGYNDVENVSKGDIVFQDMRTISESMVDIYPRIGKPDPFKGNKIKDIGLKCFLIAEKYQFILGLLNPYEK